MSRAAIAAAAALFASAPLAAQLQMRAGEDPPPGEIIGASDQGVTVRHEAAGASASEALVSWDRIKAVGGDHAEAAAPFTDVADRLWRARTRVERDDWRLGEPLFERLFSEYGDSTGPASAMVAEGLLRSRLRRGAQAAAVTPWLALVRNHRARPQGAPAAPPQPDAAPPSRRWVGGGIDLPPILDAQTALAPGLPPIWLSGPAVDAMAASADFSAATGGDEVAEALGELYRLAAAFEAGREAPFATRPASAHPGVLLAGDVVVARIGDPEQRRRAREALEARLAARPAPWIQVWCHAAIGRSLLREEEEPLRRRGVLHLLHIPAQHGADHPYLAGLALAEAAVAMADAGDHTSAAALHVELERTFSDHPALAWPPLRRIEAPPGGRPPSDAQPDAPTDPKGAA